MALQYNVDSVDTLSEEVRGLYVQDGDKYRLDVTDVKPMAEFQKVYRVSTPLETTTKLPRPSLASLVR